MPIPTVESFEQGHLVRLYWQPSTVIGSAFEEIGPISQGDLERGFEREQTKRQIRGSTVDSYMSSEVTTRPPWAFTVSVVGGDTQYQALRAAALANETHGFMQRGFDPDGNPSDAYEVCSGKFSKCQFKSPLENGEVAVDMEIRPSGPFIIDGITKS